ncbi:MAG: hypothetical protein ACP5LR_08830 [Athalassotoga sp.]
MDLGDEFSFLPFVEFEDSDLFSDAYILKQVQKPNRSYRIES